MLRRNKKAISIFYIACVFIILTITAISLKAYISNKKSSHRDSSKTIDFDMDNSLEHFRGLDEAKELDIKEETELQKQLRIFIAKLKAENKLSMDDEVGIYVFDISKGEKLVGINEDEPLQAASMIKPIVALAFFHQVEHGYLSYTEESKRKMQAMIQRSRNGSTNWIMEKIGGPEKVQEILDNNYNMLFSATKVVEYIPLDGKTYLNKASVKDYSRFLYSLWNRLLPYSDEFLRLMSLENRDMVSHGVEGMPGGVMVYDKTGSTGQVTGDIAIIEPQSKNGRKCPYILICVIQCHTIAPNYTIWHKKTKAIIREISSIVYADIKKRYNLM